MAGYNNRIVAVMVFSTIMIIATQSLHSSVQSLAQEDGREPQIPQAICNYAGQKYYLTPHIYNDGEKSNRINFPDLPEDHVPQMIVKTGDELTMEFDDKKPVEIQALLVDYDADITETYSLGKVDESTFGATEEA